MNRRLLTHLVLALSIPTALSAQQKFLYPTTIYYGGHILTGNRLTTPKPEVVTAMAIRDGHIVATGKDELVLRLKGPSTKLFNLRGKFVMPGFNDAHVHLGGAGQTKLNVDLTGSTSLAEMLQRIAVNAQGGKPDHWLRGGGWDHTLWQDKTLPTRADLDKVTNGHPALLERIDGHIAIANSAALKAAGITRDTPDPKGGKIDHDEKGEPTGILRETAMEEAEKVIPPPTPEDRRRGLELAIADATTHGITSVQDFSEWQDFLTFEQLEKEQRLTLRITEWLPFDLPLSQLIQMRTHHDASDPMLHTGMLKGFMDGSLGSHTAAMKQPFTDDPGNSGIPRHTQDQLNAMTTERARAGFQIGFHAIGDRAASMALDAFSAAESSFPAAKKQRFRIEHSQVVDPADILRYKQLGVIASMQPNHLLTDMHWAEARLGKDRAAYSYAWKAFLNAGVPLAFGTDYPVEPVTPFRGLYCAVTRMDETGKQTYFPQNKLSIGEALYAYTQGAAYAEFAEQTKGILAPGYWADFVILDRDLTAIPPEQIPGTQVLETVLAGKTVYLANMHALGYRKATH